MAVDSDLLQRLRRRILEDEVALSVEDLHPNFTFDDGIFHLEPPEAARWVLDRHRGEELVDVAVLAETIADRWFCLTARGRSAFTNQWHQCAWMFEMHEGRLLRMVVTVSAPVPPVPQDGTFRVGG